MIPVDQLKFARLKECGVGSVLLQMEGCPSGNYLVGSADSRALAVSLSGDRKFFLHDLKHGSEQLGVVPNSTEILVDPTSGMDIDRNDARPGMIGLQGDMLRVYATMPSNGYFTVPVNINEAPEPEKLPREVGFSRWSIVWRDQNGETSCLFKFDAMKPDAEQ